MKQKNQIVLTVAKQSPVLQKCCHNNIWMLWCYTFLADSMKQRDLQKSLLSACESVQILPSVGGSRFGV